MRYLSLLLILAACGDSNSPQLQPAAFQLVDGAAQVDTVGRELKDMIAVRVIATDGATAVPNIPITWTPLDGGQVLATVVFSGSDGIARQRYTLGTTAGTQRVRLTALDGETGDVLVDDTVTAEAVPGSATTFVVTFGPFDNANELAVGDTGIIAYWYGDAFGNTGAGCADGGSPHRIIWDSKDSASVEPLGTLISLDSYAAWYGQRGLPVPPYATQVVAKEVRTNGVDVTGFATQCAPGSNGAGVSFLVR